jgi:hypothetical protein
MLEDFRIVPFQGGGNVFVVLYIVDLRDGVFPRWAIRL